MLRTLSLLAIGVCANALVGVTAWAQTPPEVTLTRFDCGIGQSPIDPARFNDTFAFPELKVTITFSCYLVKHGTEYMVWDTGFAVGANPNAPKVSIVDQLDAFDAVDPGLRKYRVEPRDLALVGGNHELGAFAVWHAVGGAEVVQHPPAARAVISTLRSGRIIEAGMDHLAVAR